MDGGNPLVRSLTSRPLSGGAFFIPDNPCPGERLSYKRKTRENRFFVTALNEACSVAAFITWCDDWLLGIEALDEQHKALADCINKLVVECAQAEPATPESALKRRERLAQQFNALYTTTKKHFSFEEALMRDEGYPSYATHAREHIMLIAELKDTLVNGLTDGYCNLNPDALKALKSWLIAHVSSSDREFADFLLKKRHSRAAVSQPDH